MEAESNLYTSYPKVGAVKIGILQVVGALVLIGLQVGFFVEDLTHSYVSTGFWAGGFFLICGILSLASGKNNSRGLVVAVMVMDILGCFLAAVTLAVAIAIPIVGWFDEEDQYEGEEDKYYVEWGLSQAQAGCAGIEGILAFIGSILCCVGCCSRPQQTGGQVMYVHTNAGGVPQNNVYVTTQGQPYPQQGYANQGYSPQGQYPPQGQLYPQLQPQPPPVYPNKV